MDNALRKQMNSSFDAGDVDYDDDKLALLSVTVSVCLLSNELRIVEAEMVRTRLLRSEYPFPCCTRKWCWLCALYEPHNVSKRK